MTKHRTMTGFAAIDLPAATAAMRSQSPSIARSVAPIGMMPFTELAADANRPPTANFRDPSPVNSICRQVRAS